MAPAYSTSTYAFFGHSDSGPPAEPTEGDALVVHWTGHAGISRETARQELSGAPREARRRAVRGHGSPG
ncbi:hypothetical protein ACWZEH_02585 [Streptomyces sp. QTS137]